MESDELRLEILKLLIPSASRLGLDKPELVVEKAAVFEQYVVNGQQSSSEEDETVDTGTEKVQTVKRRARRNGPVKLREG